MNYFTLAQNAAAPHGCARYSRWGPRIVRPALIVTRSRRGSLPPGIGDPHATSIRSPGRLN